MKARAGMSDLLKRELVRLNTRLLGEGVMARLDKIPTRLNQYGYDEFGFRPELIKYIASVGYALYNNYWRVKTYGIENIPKDGRVLLIANHSGQLPWDGFQIACAVFFEANPPRIVRAMIEKWAATLPFAGQLLSRLGQIIGTPENCLRLLKNEEAILVFPEGAHGINKLFKDRYQLTEFGHGFMRLALQTNTPIVPIAVIGAEEYCPAVYNVKPLAKLMGMPAFPITPTFPLLGPLGILPYPTKIRIYFGEPMRFSGDPDEEDTETDRKVQTVRNTIQSMIYDGLHARKHLFF
jgi:1-acyl-sn-glycerol-3-phosphate acyltransferase